MKKISLVLTLLYFFNVSHAQSLKNGIGIHFTGLDFYGPQTGDYLLNDKLNKTTAKTQKRLLWEPSIRASYWHAFSKRFDITAGVNVSSLQYPRTSKDSNYIKTKLGTNSFKQELPYAAVDAKLNFNLLTRESHIISPYLTVGASASFRATDHGFDIPAGIGFNIKLAKGMYINLESDYRVAMGEKNQDHLSHSVGLVYWWSRTKQAKVIPPPTPKPVAVIDTDNDGIPDSEDACPTQAGKKEMKGCPDKDNDGIADKDDSCPDIAGLKQFNGCPDTDGDGIPDNKDNCPTEKGTVKYNGCPIPDRDGDGFNDEVDKCPDIASRVNNGCPEIKQEDKKKIEMAAKGVNFESGSAVIKPNSFANLDKIVEILKAQPSYLVDIEGHTDNSGKAEKNLILSQQRADACKQYLVGKGIEDNRISSKGFGDSKPIGDNTKPEGRAKNRRTEFNIKSF